MSTFIRSTSAISLFVCTLFATCTWAQSNKSQQPLSPASPNASAPVKAQVPTMTTPAEGSPNPSALAATAPNAAANPPASTPLSVSSSDLVIGVGDLLEIAVFGAADFNKQVRVSSSGDISLPLIGGVHVAGLTTADAEKLVEKKLLDGGFFNDPHVSIFEKEYQTQGVSVLGEVHK